MGKKSSKETNKVEEDIEFLVENTKFNEKTIRKFYEGFLQDSENGRMSKEEFSANFQTAFCCGRKNEDLSSHLFKALDTDSNGYIDFR